jgi:hypothetical protein
VDTLVKVECLAIVEFQVILVLELQVLQDIVVKVVHQVILERVELLAIQASPGCQVTLVTQERQVIVVNLVQAAILE